MKINIYIGYDSREKIASEVCKFSIKKNSTIKTNIKLLKKKNLEEKKFFFEKMINSVLQNLHSQDSWSLI